MKKIIYSTADGGVAVVTPVINNDPPEDITEEESIKRAWDALPPNAINPQVVEAETIPKDRTFRNAWKVNGRVIEHDMEKCREIHKTRLRVLRAPKLASLDVEYMRADEAGDTKKKAEIVKKKQALRDLTDAVALAQLPSDLVIPAELA